MKSWIAAFLPAVVALALVGGCSREDRSGADEGARPLVTPDEVRSLLNTRGAEGAIAELSGGEGPNRYQAVLAGMADGEAGWLELAPLLRPGAEGEAGDGLMAALSRGLIRNPAGVLALASDALPLVEICGESRIGPAEADVAAFKREATAAVRALDAPALKTARATCLEGLEAIP